MSDNITIVSRSTNSSTHSGNSGAVLPAALPDQTTVTNPEILAAGATTATAGMTASSAALAAQNATTTTGSVDIALLPQPQSHTQHLLQPPPLNPTKSPAFAFPPSSTIPLALRIQSSRRSIRNVNEYEAAFAALVRDSQARMEKVELSTTAASSSSSLPLKVVAPKAAPDSSLSDTMDLKSILAKRQALYPSLYNAEASTNTSNEALQAELRSYAVELPKAAPKKVASSTTSSTKDKGSIASEMANSFTPLPSTDGAADNRKRTRDESEDATVKATNEEEIDPDKASDAAPMLLSSHASPPLKIARTEDATSSAEVAPTTGNDVLAKTTDGMPTAPAPTTTAAPDGQQPMLSVSSSTTSAQASINTANAATTGSTTPKLETDASTIAPADATSSLGNPLLTDATGSVAADDGTAKPAAAVSSLASTEQKTPSTVAGHGHSSSATNTNSGSLPVATNSTMTTDLSATSTNEPPETLAGGQPPIPPSNLEISGATNATAKTLSTASQQQQQQVPQFSHLPLPPPLPFPAGLQPPPLPQAQPGAAMAALPPQPALQPPPQPPPQPRFYTDIWGRFPAKEPSYLIECSVCKSTKVNALRFASHLDKCLGIRTMGRSAAAAAASAAAASSIFHASNSINAMTHSSHAK